MLHLLIPGSETAFPPHIIIMSLLDSMLWKKICTSASTRYHFPIVMAEIMCVVMDNFKAGKGARDPVEDQSIMINYDHNISHAETDFCVLSS